MKAIKKLYLPLKILVTVVLFTVLLFIFPRLPLKDPASILASTSLLFAILVGFFIAATMSNYFRLQSLIATETSNLITLYSLTKLIDKTQAPKLADTIDSYIIRAYDFELIKYTEGTWEEFNAVIEVLDEIQVKNREEKDILFEVFVEKTTDLYNTRQEISLTVRRIIAPFFWGVLIFLALMIISLLYLTRENTLVSSFFTVSFSIGVCLILFLLYQIDNNIFAEKELGYDVFQRVFLGIGKLRYYPEVDLKEGRIKPPEDEDYRVGIYKNWPYSREKEEIRVIKAKEKRTKK